MKRTRINPYSLKRIAELNTEAPIRVALCRRAHGYPEAQLQIVYLNGEKYTITRIICRNGIDEITGERCALLEPHEKIPRGRGGKLSMENSVMVSRKTHIKEQKSSPIWSSPNKEGG